MDNLKVISLFKGKSYEDVFPRISILGKKVDFFIECSSYDVILPVKAKSEGKLDLFEEAVLKFLNYKVTTDQEIADILCLTPDLINFIIIRLQEMGFLKDNKSLTEIGERYLNIVRNDSIEQNIEYVQAKIFVLKQTGEILPYVQYGELIGQPIENLSGRLLTVDYGTAGSPLRVKGLILSQGKGRKKENLLDSSIIRATVDKYNKIVQEMLNYSVINYAKDWAIENTVSDNVYFHMQAVIQDGNIDEILVSDGLVVNIDIVKNYIKKNQPEFISNLKERCTKNVIIDDSKETLNILGNDKFRELNKLMKKIKESSAIYEYKEDDEPLGLKKDENQALQSEQKKFLLNCYAGFEWALYYYVKKYPLNSSIRSVIESQIPAQNVAMLLEMAQKIGVRYPKKYENLFYGFDIRRVQRVFKTDIPELRVVLALAIITSVYNNESEFRALFRRRQGLFRILNDLHKEHGDLSHQTFTPEINKIRNKEIYELLIDFIDTLQINLDNENSENINQNNKVFKASQEKLNAEVSLSKRLGAAYYYNLLPATIKEEWILIAPNKVNYPENSEYADILYRIMQDTLYYQLKEIKKDVNLSKADILKGLKEKNIASNSLDTVYENFVEKALNNENGTLGSNAMVYLYYQRDEFITKLQEYQFVKVIEELVELRKHGNNVGLSVNADILHAMRDNMLSIVKLIGEN
jgi:hypothetical protein